MGLHTNTLIWTIVLSYSSSNRSFFFYFCFYCTKLYFQIDACFQPQLLMKFEKSRRKMLSVKICIYLLRKGERFLFLILISLFFQQNQTQQAPQLDTWFDAQLDQKIQNVPWQPPANHGTRLASNMASPLVGLTSTIEFVQQSKP